MSNLSINVQVGDTPPSTATVDGTGLAASAWKASLFLRNPARSQGPPAGSADSTATTDGSGNATFTGLSSVDYWIEVIDARGVTNWFPVQAARVGGADRFICTIPWSTPTSVTSPLDDRGGDTQGGRTNQGLWAPRTHIHQIPAGGSGIATGQLVCVIALPNGGAGATVAWQSGPNTLALPHALYDPYSAADGTGFTVPSALVGANLWADMIVEYGGTTATAVLPTTAFSIVYQPQSGPAIQLGQSILSLPAGNITWAGSLSINGATSGIVTSVALGETFIAQPWPPSLGSGSSMYWGGDVSTTGRYSQMRIFTC